MQVALTYLSMYLSKSIIAVADQNSRTASGDGLAVPGHGPTGAGAGGSERKFWWKFLPSVASAQGLTPLCCPRLQVDCVEEALARSQQPGDGPALQVSILLDYMRGSRGLAPRLFGRTTRAHTCAHARAHARTHTCTLAIT